MVLYYIYCIWVKTHEGVLRYYGHTENTRVRKNKHVSDHKKWVAAGRPEKVSDINGTRSVYVLEHEDWRMDVVDTIECETKDEARTLEGKWILNNTCTNMIVSGRTKQEYKKQYREAHKEERKEYNKQYREEHKEQTKKYKKKYLEQNKEQTKEYAKQYYEKNKEERSEYAKKYREQNKTEIASKASEKVTCEVCGSVVRKDFITAHRRSKKHLNALSAQ